jgi:hypothetical protein
MFRLERQESGDSNDFFAKPIGNVKMTEDPKRRKLLPELQNERRQSSNKSERRKTSSESPRRRRLSPGTALVIRKNFEGKQSNSRSRFVFIIYLFLYRSIIFELTFLWQIL